MPLAPVRDLLYVLPIEITPTPASSLVVAPETYTKIITQDDGSKIELPQTTRRRPNQGIVKYRGPATSGEILMGDHVIFSPYDGDEVLYPGEGRFIVIHEGDVIARMEPGEDSYALTIPQVKAAIQRAAERIAMQLGMDYQEKEARLFLARVERLKEELDAHFIEELYF